MPRWTKIHTDMIIAEKTSASDRCTVVHMDQLSRDGFDGLIFIVDDCVGEPFVIGDRFRVSFERLSEENQ